MELLERVQYKAALIVSGCWQGTSREKLYEMSLAGSRCLTGDGLVRLVIFYKIHNDLTPSYLAEHIPKRNELDIFLRNRNVNTPLTRTERYNSFIPYTIKAWENLENKAKSKPSVQSFKMCLNGLYSLFLVTLFLEYVINMGLNYSLK